MTKTATPPPQVELRATDDLVPYARNARKHSPEQVAQIAASIREFGFMAPVLVDGQGTIIAGHGRVLAARKLKLKQIPVIVHAHLTDAQRRAYIIADNQIALNSTWDDELLKVELADIHNEGLDLGLLGFDAEQLGKIMDLDLPAEPAEEAPESSYSEQYGVIVVCKDAGHQEAVYNELQAAGHECKVVVT